jgi:4-amino-4-deoxy-L-arabinose transferase-like glycosyltransferase
LIRLNHLRNLLLLSAVVFATSFPFVNRAFFVDDHYFYTIAKHLTVDPLHPYDFRADDEFPQTLGWERGHPPRMVNPLLFHYYLAGVMRVWGEATWKLRTSTLPFSVLAVCSMYFLGFRFTSRPLYAAVLLAITPAYWLTSYSLLIDSAMIGFFLAALWTFVAGLERRHSGLIVLSGVLMGATMLTKYSGGLILPLAVLWQVRQASDRRWFPGYLACAIALVILGAWNLWTVQLYGAPHLLASAARGVKAGEPFLFYLYKALTVGSFLGGGSLFLLASPLLLGQRSRIAIGALSVLLVGLIGVFSSAVGGFSLSLSVQLAFWITTCASFFGLLMVEGWPSDSSRRFLYVWLFIGMAELVIVMPWTAGRYLLVILPPVVWLFDQMCAESFSTRGRAIILIMTAIGAYTLARADRAQANVIEVLAQHLIEKDCSKVGCYYLGDTFSAYPAYLDGHGWRAAFPNQTYHSGDIIVVAHYRQSSWWTLPDTLVRNHVGSATFVSALPVRLMDVPASAGWYASCWGALPFTFTTHPLERYDVYEIFNPRSN